MRYAYLETAVNGSDGSNNVSSLAITTVGIQTLYSLVPKETKQVDQVYVH